MLDANDNAPVSVSEVSLPENSPIDTVAFIVSATAAGDGAYVEASYLKIIPNCFPLILKQERFELLDNLILKRSPHVLRVQEKDGAGLASYSNLYINIIDVNDNVLNL